VKWKSIGRFARRSNSGSEQHTKQQCATDVPDLMNEELVELAD